MRRLLMPMAVFALVVAACGAGDTVATSSSTTTSTTVAGGLDGPAEQLAAARSLWDAEAPADYTVALSGGAGNSSTVAVHDGESITLADTAEPVTVPDLFNTIEESIGDGAVVDVQYHPVFGYPIRIVIDLDGDGIPDIDLELSDLTAMPIVRSLDDLFQSWELWEDQQLESYRYIFRADCTCDDGGTWDVAVRGDRVIAEPLDEAARESQLTMTTIERTFEDLEEWFTDAEQFAEEGLLALDVRSDPKLGYSRWFRLEGVGVGDDHFEEPFVLIATVEVVGPLDPEEPEEPQGNEDDVAAFVAAAEQMERFSLRDYTYVLTRHCECPAGTSGPFKVVVAGDRFLSASLVTDGTSVDEEELPFGTFTDAMATISLFMNAGNDVAVNYHPVLGYPIDASLDTAAVVVDGGLSFAISDVRPTGDEGVLAGRVLAGPQCPVETDPPRPGCEDQPVPNAIIGLGEVDWNVLTEIPVAEDGTFAIRVPAGTYVIQAEPVEGYLGTPGPIEFEIVAGEILDLVVMYDTGIR